MSINMSSEVNEAFTLAQAENIQHYRKWCKELPALHFEKEWDVMILPPYAGAIIRFVIRYKDKAISVFFDANSRLGYMYDENEEPIPYYEMYDGEDIHRYYLGEHEQMMDDIRKVLNS